MQLDHHERRAVTDKHLMMRRARVTPHRGELEPRKGCARYRKLLERDQQIDIDRWALLGPLIQPSCRSLALQQDRFDAIFLERADGLNDRLLAREASHHQPRAAHHDEGRIGRSVHTPEVPITE